MRTDDSAGVRTLATLRAAGGTGVVRLEERYAAELDDLWSTLTEPARLARWLGEVDGEVRPGSEFRARFAATGWEGTCRVAECDPPHRFVLETASEDQPQGAFVVTLTADGDHTVLVVEDHGVPADDLADYAAGDQIHLEDLAAHLAGRERCDARTRWRQLRAAYDRVAVDRG